MQQSRMATFLRYPVHPALKETLRSLWGVTLRSLPKAPESQIRCPNQLSDYHHTDLNARFKSELQFLLAGFCQYHFKRISQPELLSPRNRSLLGNETQFMPKNDPFASPFGLSDWSKASKEQESVFA